MTTNKVTTIDNNRLAPKLSVELNFNEEKPDEGPKKRCFVYGDRMSEEEKTIIKRTKTLVTLFERDSCPEAGVKGDGPEGSGL